MPKRGVGGWSLDQPVARLSTALEGSQEPKELTRCCMFLSWPERVPIKP